MIRLAVAALCTLAALAHAATPLLVPAEPAGARAKSTRPAVRFNVAELAALRAGAEVELTLPDGSRHAYLYERSVDHGGGYATWIARSPLTGDNERAVITHGPHGAWGWMKTRYGDYRIHPSGEGDDLVTKRAATSQAPKSRGGDDPDAATDDPRVEPLKGVATIGAAPVQTHPFAKVMPSPTLQADIMFIYTRDLANKLGASLMPMLYNVVATSNQAYLDSEIAVTLRLVNATMLDYANGDSPSPNGTAETLDAMRGVGPNAPVFELLTWGTNSLRNAVGADFVALVRDGPTDIGGMGFRLNNSAIYPAVNPVSTNAYSVSNRCATGDCLEIVTHELGHNFGNRHDQATTAYDNGGVVLSALFPYSYGWYSCANGLTCNPFVAGGCSNYAQCASPTLNDFGTVMSYFTPRIMKFSNPALTNCVPAGGNAGAARACGGSPPAPAPAGSSDNALSMNNVRGSVSAYRTQTLANLAGSVQFTNVAYSAAEGGNLVFTVSRASGTTGAATVGYAVTGSTATAGVDFAAASGTLSWANGDGASKTITVPLSADLAAEGIETLTATLSGLTGGPGVHFGHPTIATGLIGGAWPMGNVGGLPASPAGWSTPAASSIPWAIASDSAPPGDTDGMSLKSGALNFAVRNCNDATYGTIPCPSMVEYTGTFAAGTVSYAYRVSGYPGRGFLEFLVDGAVVHSISGPDSSAAADTGWRYFSTALTAGAHTLRWQYRTRFNFPCANAISSPNPAPNHPGCVDRAWIDQLSLPVVKLSPAPGALDFGGQSMNTTSPSLSATITNASSATVNVTGVTASPGYTVASHNCATLAPGATCQATLTFTPPAGPATASRPGTLTLSFAGGANTLPLAGTAERSLVTHYYRSILRRAPDAGGKTFWEGEATRVAALGANVNETWFAMAQAFYSSAEYAALNRDNTGYATDLYNTFFNRAPDSGGLAFWLGQLDSGLPREVALASFMFSTEFATFTQAIFGNTGVRAEVNTVVDFYRGLLARTPDDGGFAFWVGRFRAAQCQNAAAVTAEVEAISSAYTLSAEYAARNRTHAQYVGDLYNAFLRRGGDLAGVQFWIDQVATGARTREQVRIEFRNSPEFQARVNAIIAQGCL